MSADTVVKEIESRLLFLPPFFSPAIENPAVLDNLWRQTKSAYLDNPLPALFKEKLAALLGRYCEIPYCLMCHTCTLRPLGLGGAAIVELLGRSHPSDAQVRRAAARFETESGEVELELASDSTEQALFTLSGAVYWGGPSASEARRVLRQRLSASTFQHLIVFISYNRMCHEWVIANPGISYELDQRYKDHYEALVTEAPELARVLAELGVPAASAAPPAEAPSTAPRTEIVRSIEISEQRLFEVLRNLNATVSAATEQASRSESAVEELRRGAELAQQLVAIASHELRNPLGVVLMSADIIAKLHPP